MPKPIAYYYCPHLDCENLEYTQIQSPPRPSRKLWDEEGKPLAPITLRIDCPACRRPMTPEMVAERSQPYGLDVKRARAERLEGEQ